MYSIPTLLKAGRIVNLSTVKTVRFHSVYQSDSLTGHLAGKLTTRLCSTGFQLQMSRIVMGLIDGGVLEAI